MRTLIFILMLFPILFYGQQPNIIIVMTDDNRHDVNNENYFPNISRIAEEGMKYTNAFTTYSLCTPARATIQSGLYPNKNNNLYNYNDGNGSVLDTSHFILAPELKNAGYYTAFIGKAFNDWKKPLRGYNYWAGSTAGATYDNPSFNVNGVNQTIPGYFSEIIFDLALSVLNSAPSNKPVFLMICDKAPHSPLINTTAFDNINFPTPTNFFKYQSNFPSFLYPLMEYTESLTKLEKKIEKAHETLAFTDTGVGRILMWLEQNNELDSTMIIYTNDNGFMYGEHKLNSKGMCYDECIRIPLSIRYPEWFNQGETSTQMVLNTDILPTVFEAAGVNYSGDLDGEIVTEVDREMFLFQFQVDAIPGLPTFRGIRTPQYKYVEHYCTDTIFELFDFTIDPLENTNVAYALQYLTIREQLKNSLDSIRASLNDTDLGENLSCFLANPMREMPQYSDRIFDFYGREMSEENLKGLYIRNRNLIWIE